MWRGALTKSYRAIFYRPGTQTDKFKFGFVETTTQSRGKGGNGGNRSPLVLDNRPEKRPHEDNDEETSVNQQILEALKTQNSLLRSIDARLGRIERKEQGNNLRRPRRQPPAEPVTGSWKFVESLEASQKRKQDAKHKEEGAHSMFEESYEEFGSFGLVDGEGLVLTSEAFPKGSHPSSSYRYASSWPEPESYTPQWRSTDLRNSLPQLVFNNNAELRQETGTYALTIKYNKNVENQADQDLNRSHAGIIIGEMEFNNQGLVMAEGADWDRLLNNQKQTQLPYAHGARGVPTWLSRKVTEPWEDGDELKFRIDTNENTIVYQRGRLPKKTFWNVLAFTNNRKYPDFLRVYAYCGAIPRKIPPPAKLTII